MVCLFGRGKRFLGVLTEASRAAGSQFAQAVRPAPAPAPAAAIPLPMLLTTVAAMEAAAAAATARPVVPPVMEIRAECAPTSRLGAAATLLPSAPT